MFCHTERRKILEKPCFWASGLLIVFSPAELVARWSDWLALSAPIQVGWPVKALLVLTPPPC